MTQAIARPAHHSSSVRDLRRRLDGPGRSPDLHRRGNLRPASRALRRGRNRLARAIPAVEPGVPARHRPARARHPQPVDLWRAEHARDRVATTLLAFAIGVALGTAAALARGWMDQVMSRAVDVLMAIPQLVFALVLLTIFGTSIPNLVLIMAVLDSTRVYRLVARGRHECRRDGLRRGGASLRGEAARLDHRCARFCRTSCRRLVAEFGLRFCFVFLTICGAVLPRRGHPAAHRRLGIDGARERDADHLWRSDAAVSRRRDRPFDHCINVLVDWYVSRAGRRNAGS